MKKISTILRLRLWAEMTVLKIALNQHFKITISGSDLGHFSTNASNTVPLIHTEIYGHCVEITLKCALNGELASPSDVLPGRTDKLYASETS